MKKTFRFFIASIIMVFGMIFVTAELTDFEKAHASDDYPQKYKNYERDAIADEWNFYNRECTSFVAWCLNSRNGIQFNNWYKGVLWGHAYNWGKTAKSLGITVDNNPTVGSVAWWNGGSTGHVAWVSEVNGSTVSIEEYNYNFNGLYNTRDIDKSDPTGYIHVQDIPQEQYLDINWIVDGELICGECPCASLDVYINGTRDAKAVKDYYVKWSSGTNYTIKNIKVKSGYTYNGIVMGKAKGTIGSEYTEIRLSFSKKTVQNDNKKLVSSGKWQYCVFPDGFDNGHWLYSKYKTEALSNKQQNGKTLEVTQSKLIGYIYYHWTPNKYRLYSENYNVFINDKYCWENGREYYNFKAFFSSVDYGHEDKNGVNGGDCFFAWFDNPEDGSWWWFRVPVYEQTYKIYEKQNIINGRVQAPKD